MLKNFKVIVFCTFVAFGGFLVSTARPHLEVDEGCDCAAVSLSALTVSPLCCVTLPLSSATTSVSSLVS